MYELIPS